MVLVPAAPKPGTRTSKKLHALPAGRLATARAWELKEAFSHFWTYESVIWAGASLDYWVLPRHAQRPGTDEEGGLDVAFPRATDPQPVSGKRRDFQRRGMRPQ
jgi:hypothetical protein